MRPFNWTVYRLYTKNSKTTPVLSGLNTLFMCSFVLACSGGPAHFSRMNPDESYQFVRSRYEDHGDIGQICDGYMKATMLGIKHVDSTSFRRAGRNATNAVERLLVEEGYPIDYCLDDVALVDYRQKLAAERARPSRSTSSSSTRGTPSLGPLSCQTVGSMTYCRGSSGSFSCQSVGSSTYCR